MAWMTDPAEADFVAAVLADLSDPVPKLVYADWLEERSDPRGVFLRAFADACRAVDHADWPSGDGLADEWLDLIGYSLLDAAMIEGAGDLGPLLLRHARPALTPVLSGRRAQESGIPAGASRLGGMPGLPPGFAWPAAADCPARPDGGAPGGDELAGFLGQVNLAEIVHTQAARTLPKSGVLSFFSGQNLGDGGEWTVGRVLYFPGKQRLRRAAPPRAFTEWNAPMPARRLRFAEVLDVPDHRTGPWACDFAAAPDPGRLDAVLGELRCVNFMNLLGYTHAGFESHDPTPDRSTRHLASLRNGSGNTLHFQIAQADLDARNFDAATLPLVEHD